MQRHVFSHVGTNAVRHPAVVKISLNSKPRTRAFRVLPGNSRSSRLPIMSQAASNQTNKQALEEFYNGFKDKFVAVQVSPEKLNTLLDEGKQDIVVVDVRSDEERKVSHLPGSISKAAFEANSAQYKSHMVVSYCTVGYRSGKYADGLLEKGFKLMQSCWQHPGMGEYTPTKHCWMGACTPHKAFAMGE
eukprot:jgi/Botrbrau1/18168/Bobra.53_1s0037.2